jgi:hypothetical protein
VTDVPDPEEGVTSMFTGGVKELLPTARTGPFGAAATDAAIAVPASIVTPNARQVDVIVMMLISFNTALLLHH